MNEYMITIAYYSEIADANRHVELLKAEGIRCELIVNDPNSGIYIAESQDGEFEIQVHQDDFERADMILDMDDQEIARGKPSAERPGDRNKLTGGIISMVGILTAMGNFDGLPDGLIMLPYALAAIGGLFYVRGIAQAHVDEDELREF